MKLIKKGDGPHNVWDSMKTPVAKSGDQWETRARAPSNMEHLEYTPNTNTPLIPSEKQEASPLKKAKHASLAAKFKDRVRRSVIHHKSAEKAAAKSTKDIET